MSIAVAENAKRKPLSKASQLRIFRRDGWLCCWCKRPVIFGPVMKFLELEVRSAGHTEPLAYYHAHWTRESSPLLDELGAVLDHKEAFSTGGPCSEENLCTACCKCNGRKGSASTVKWDGRKKRSPIKGKYGEPQHWDGLSSVFVMLAKRNLSALTAGEREWVKVLGAPTPMTHKPHIEKLKDVIRELHGVHATHIESVPVKETHQGETVWDGVVEVFDLIGHPKTHRVYAWAHETGDAKKSKRHVTVLHIPPVVSPETAVRAAIIQEYRNNA